MYLHIYNTAAAAAATTTAQVTPTTGESVPERTISLFPNAPWSTHHLGIFEFCLQICQTRVTNNQTMLAPSLYKRPLMVLMRFPVSKFRVLDSYVGLME
eukprot:jgi/Picre1/30024/NNA_005397.t1